MKLAWFSPLPPARSDIANFSRRLAGALQRRHETRFFEETGEGFREPAARAEHPTPLGTVAPGLIPLLNRFDVPVYNLGNHPGFFSHTWFLSQRKPGIVILHDLKLHHFFEGIYRERLGDQSTYLQWLRRDYGSPGYEAGMAYWQQEVSIDFMAQHFPMTAWAIQGALAVVVHTRPTLSAVKALTDAPVVCLPLPYPASATPGPSAEPNAPGVAARGRARLVLFGYLNANRRVVEFLAALAGMPERACVDVQIYGELHHAADVERALDAHALRGQVTLHGYVSEEELEAGLERADLAINLRYPSLGEASGSQLRLWDHALPSLVTQTGGYADLPEDAVFFVRPEHEAEDIQTHLRKLLAQPELFRAAGRRGRQYLREEHQPEAYVQQLDELLRNLGELRSRRNRERLADHAGTGASSWLDAAPATAREWHHAHEIMRIV